VDVKVKTNICVTPMRNEGRISKIDELIIILSKKNYKHLYTRAKTKEICIICGQKALSFTNSIAKFEYNISAICESCQSDYLHMKCEHFKRNNNT
jgi:hypothetical protein